MSTATRDTAAPTGTDTKTSTGLLLLRIALGITFILHGASEIFGAFGGPGLANFVKNFGPIGYLVALGQFGGGIGILFGFLTRFSAAVVALEMLVAIVKVHLPNGFFMNWFGKQAGEGYEFHVLVIGMCLTLVFAGPGRLSVQNGLPGVLRKL